MKTEIEKRAKEIGQEPAFPTSSLEAAFGDKGLTKLEWFMGMAIQGLIKLEPDYAMTPYQLACESAIRAEVMIHKLAEMEVVNGK